MKARSTGSAVPTLMIGMCLGIAAGLGAYYALQLGVLRMLPKVKVTANTSPGAQPPNIRGLEKAPVVLEEFSDFQCPPCKSLSEVLRKVEQAHRSQVVIIYRHYPIASLHKNAYGAAVAAEAAGVQGHFWEMHDKLFDQQSAWAASGEATSLFGNYARSIGLNVEQFESDLKDTRAQKRVLADERRGNSIGVPGTPIVLINGLQVPYDRMSYKDLNSAIERELKDSPGGSVAKRQGRVWYPAMNAT